MLKKLILAIFMHVKKFLNFKDFEIFLVNDSSQDNSWEIICELSKKYKNLKGINLKKKLWTT